MVRRFAAVLFVAFSIGVIGGDLDGSRRAKSSSRVSLVSESLSFRREQEQ